MKKLFILFTLIILLFSCSSINNKSDKNTDTFIRFVAREEYMKKVEPERIFNPGPAMVISTLPEKIGNMKSVDQINDFEIMNNGLGYSKRYKNKSIKKGYWIDFFAYHSKQSSISDDIDEEISKAVYEISKNEILKSYNHYKKPEENILILTTPSGKILKMREIIFEYWNPLEKINIKSYMYFGTNLDSFYKIRVSYDLKFEDKVYNEKEYFIKDLGYYYAEGMSLKNFNEFKKSGIKNPIKMERI